MRRIQRRRRIPPGDHAELRNGRENAGHESGVTLASDEFDGVVFRGAGQEEEIAVFAATFPAFPVSRVPSTASSGLTSPHFRSSRSVLLKDAE